MRALFALLLSIGCRERLDLHPTQFGCERARDCGDGTVCLEGRCQAP